MLFKSKIFILILIAVFGWTAYSFIFQKENEIEINLNKSIMESNSQALTALKDINDNQVPNNNQKDSDGDGLLDWEEKIYGTDPQNPDTDGDGYKDGDEIATNHNPLKKAPGDSLKDYPLNSSPSDKKNDPNNITQRLTASLADEIIQKNKTRNDNKPGLNVPKINDFIPQFLKEKVSAEEYNFSADADLKEIKISKDNSKKAVRKYLDNFKSIIDRYFSFSDKNAQDIINDAYKIGNFSEFDNLLLAYDGAIKEFYNLPAPSDWAISFS